MNCVFKLIYMRDLLLCMDLYINITKYELEVDRYPTLDYSKQHSTHAK